jgi:hypothetical protein
LERRDYERYYDSKTAKSNHYFARSKFCVRLGNGRERGRLTQQELFAAEVALMINLSTKNRLPIVRDAGSVVKVHLQLGCEAFAIELNNRAKRLLS